MSRTEWASGGATFTELSDLSSLTALLERLFHRLTKDVFTLAVMILCRKLSLNNWHCKQKRIQENTHLANRSVGLAWRKISSRKPEQQEKSVYDDVIMDAIASQITSLASVYSDVKLGAHQRKHQSSASLAFVRGIHRWPVNSPHKWPVTRKMFPFDDVIMSQRLNRQAGEVKKQREHNPKKLNTRLCASDVVERRCSSDDDRVVLDSDWLPGSVIRDVTKTRCVMWSVVSGLANHITAGCCRGWK